MEAGSSLNIRPTTESEEGSVIHTMPLEEEEDSVDVPPSWWLSSGQIPENSAPTTEIVLQSAADDVPPQEQIKKSLLTHVSHIPAVLEDSTIEFPQVGDEDKDNMNNYELDYPKQICAEKQQDLNNNETMAEPNFDDPKMLTVKEEVMKPDASEMCTDSKTLYEPDAKLRISESLVKPDSSESLMPTEVVFETDSAKTTGVTETVLKSYAPEIHGSDAENKFEHGSSAMVNDTEKVATSEASEILTVAQVISVVEPDASELLTERICGSDSSKMFNFTEIECDTTETEVRSFVESIVQSDASEPTVVENTIVPLDDSKLIAVEEPVAVTAHDGKDEFCDGLVKSDVAEMPHVTEDEYSAPNVISQVVKSVFLHMLQVKAGVGAPYTSDILSKTDVDVKLDSSEILSNAKTIAVKPNVSEMLIVDKESTIELDASSTQEASDVKALAVYMSTGLLGVGSLVMKWRQDLIDAENAELEVKAVAVEPSPRAEKPKSNTAEFKAWCASKKRSLSRCLRRTGGRISRSFKIK